jgi:hypothetical protein
MNLGPYCSSTTCISIFFFLSFFISLSFIHSFILYLFISSHPIFRTGIAQSVYSLPTGWTTEESEFESQYGQNFLFSTASRPALGPTQPPIQWVPGTLYPGVKQPGREADHSTPVSVEVKKMWSYTSTPSYAFMA